MAVFSNQATITYNGNTANSNIAYGEILDALAVSKTPIESGYTPGETVTYVVNLTNTGTTPLTGVTLTDNLGGYDFGGTTVYPLSYNANSIKYFVNGVLKSAPTVVQGPPMSITGLNIPAQGNAVLVYQATVTNYAPSATGSTIVNTATATGNGINTPVTATSTVTVNSNASITVNKSISPTQVTDNQQVTYTFIIQNSGNTALEATGDTVITDTFNPILSNISAVFNSTPLGVNTDYTYDTATGLFQTLAGRITVPAATVTQNPTTGEYTVTPGVSTLVITGTI